MPQELFIDNPDGAVFSLSDWEDAVENMDNVRLEVAEGDPDFTFEDAELFDEESGQWHPALRWGQNGVAFNARIVHFFSDEDPNWKIVTSLATELGATIRDEGGNVCYPENFKAEPPKVEKPKSIDSGRNPPNYKTKLEIWFGFKSLNGPLLAEEVACWLEQEKITKDIYVNHRKVSLKRIPLVVDSATYPVFQIVTSKFEVSYISPGAFEYDLFSVSCLKIVPLAFWESIIDRFREFGAFVSARLIDLEYETWQNRKDLCFYEHYGRSHAHLPKVKRDCPPPHDDLIVDISANPGRIVRSRGILEAIGGVMWLSDVFFDTTGSSKDGVRHADFLECEERGDCLAIKIDDDLLLNGDTDHELIDKQQRLRKLLFPNGSEFS